MEGQFTDSQIHAYSLMDPFYLSIESASSMLLNGEVVAIPTETVYGLAGNALDKNAVAKIFEAKNRPSFDPLIVHGPSVEALEEVAFFDAKAKALFERFAPGPLTLVLPKKEILPDLVTSGHPTVAVRIPNHVLTLDLMNRTGLLLAAPSANPFGFTSPTTSKHVQSQLDGVIAGVLDGGQCKVGVESTIVDLSGQDPRILRLGGMAYESLEEFLGPIPVQTSSSNPKAPGMLIAHYNPGVTVILCSSKEEALHLYSSDKDSGLLWFGPLIHGNTRHERILNLSERNDDIEAAQNVFSHLRTMADLGVLRLYTFELPEKGLLRAVNDRLRRAAQKN
jgi:L-threonylcarbamoyladenylate synthase